MTRPLENFRLLGRKRHIGNWLTLEIKAIEREMKAALAKPAFAPVAAIVCSIKGIADVTAAALIALLPELGHRSAKAIAALAGLAPINRDSGATRGQRHIGGGRHRVRRALYLAAVRAIRWVPHFKARTAPDYEEGGGYGASTRT